jgi:hypothetical protein
MDAHVTDEVLLTYTLGASSEDERGRIDAHLCACADCLRAFLDLKRCVEQGGQDAPRPSPATRERLRSSVAAAFRPTLAARLARTLRRPIPLYQGVAAAVLALAVATLVPFARVHAPTTAPPAKGSAELRSPSGARVDTARALPESFAIY